MAAVRTHPPVGLCHSRDVDAAHRRANAAMVGRAAEQARLREQIAALEQGPSGVVTIVGDAGVGKTSLVEGAIADAAARGFAVVVATGYELSQTTPYAPIVAALRPRLVEDAELAEGLPSLCLLFDDVVPDETSLPLSPDLARARLHHAITTVLRRLRRDRPLLLVFDDLHWMDASTIEVVHELFADVADSRILLLVAVRAVEGRDRSDVRTLLAAMRRSPTTVFVPLAPLDAEATGALLRQWLGDELPTGLVDLVMERTAGTPLLIETLMGALIDEGVLRRSELWWELGDRPVHMPAAEDLFGTRIRHLGADARFELSVLSVAGEPVTEPELAVDGLTAAERRVVLRQLRDNDLAVERADADGDVRWRPAHPLVAEVAAESLSIGERRDLHAKFFAASHGAPAERRARHLLGAGPLVDEATALAIFADAGARALERGALVESARFLSAAVEAEPDIEADPCLVRVHEMLGDVWGRRGELDLARLHLVRAYREHERVGDVAAQVALIGRIDGATWHAGTDPILEDELDALWARLQHEQRWAELGTLAFWVMVNRARRGDFPKMRELQAVALDAAARCEDPRVGLIARYVEAGQLMWMRPPSPARARVAVPAVAAVEHDALAAGFVEMADRCAHLISEVAMATRLPDLLEQGIASERAVIDRSGRHQAWRLTMLQLVDLIERGDAAALEEMHTDYLAAHGPRGAVSVGSLIAPFVELDVLPVTTDELVASVRTARANADDDGVVHLLADAVETFLLGDRVDADVARRLVDDPDAPSFLPSGSAATALVAVARAHHRLGHADAFADWIALLRAFDDGEGQLSAWAELLLVPDAATPAAAAAHFGRAAELFGAVHRPTSAASCVLRALRASPRGLDPATVDRAARQLERSGRPDLAAEIDGLARRYALVAPSAAGRSRTPPPSGLTRREQEVAQAVASGLTNKEAAEQLFISVRTVTTHLERIYAKLGITSRAELATALRAADPSGV